ncbi:Alkaline phosphatase 4 [Gryllus bimaculatus]|nr:Alkaline phosphatase 4 [Gryllus bimaculatus]
MHRSTLVCEGRLFHYHAAPGHQRVRRQQQLEQTEPGMARNVILFVGDGMGVATTTAAGILVGGEGHLLSWERFPHIGLSKTYSVDHQVPDSAATATAMLTGVKTHSRMLGLDARANTTTCDREVNREAKLASLALWAQQAGKATGVMPEESRGCVLDIARQLAEAAPGKDLHVVLGGGRRQLGASGKEDPDEDDSCLMDPELLHRADYILGLFAGGNMAYEAERRAAPGDQPSLSEMTRVALRALRRHGRDKGFFLLVEGARIDMAHHKNYARLALLEAQQLDEAVHVALDEVDIEDTLIVVTGDHSHAMTINGYPERGSDILGISYAENKRYDENAVKYETLTYATGPGAKDHQGVRVEDIPEEKRKELRYKLHTSNTPRPLNISTQIN